MTARRSTDLDLIIFLGSRHFLCALSWLLPYYLYVSQSRIIGTTTWVWDSLHKDFDVIGEFAKLLPNFHENRDCIKCSSDWSSAPLITLSNASDRIPSAISSSNNRRRELWSFCQTYRTLASSHLTVLPRSSDALKSVPSSSLISRLHSNIPLVLASRISSEDFISHLFKFFLLVFDISFALSNVKFVRNSYLSYSSLHTRLFENGYNVHRLCFNYFA